MDNKTRMGVIKIIHKGGWSELNGFRNLIDSPQKWFSPPWPINKSLNNKPLYNFLVNKWYFDELYDFIFIQSSKKIGLFFWKTIDVKIIDKFGPDGLSLLIKNLSLKASKFQSGFIYQYAFMILIGLSALWTFLILQ